MRIRDCSARIMPIPRTQTSCSRLLGTFSGALASVVFPSDCRICQSLLTRAGRIPICEPCLSSFRRSPLERCDVCGLPWNLPGENDEEFALCPQCREQKYGFELARSYGLYEGALVRAVLLLKYERIEPLGRWFADRLLELIRTDEKRLCGDVIVPVPLHRQREKERGFNQVELFARPLAKRLGLPYRPVLLMRTRPRPEKHLLGYEERWEAVRGAFVMRAGRRVDNSRILLLDDVMTTGATLDACSSALREAGASSVVALTVARAVRPASPAGP
jgi:competence protein ComFC